MSKGFSSVLNFSRWAAALLVLSHHVRHLVFVDLQDVVNNNALTKIFYFITGLGHEAVIIFFVVSGLLVGALTLEKWKAGINNGIAEYFIHRFSRIYIVLVPALIVGYCIDIFGMSFFDQSHLYSNSAQYKTISLGFVIKQNLGIDVFIGNILMLQGVVVNVLGSNGPLWSLAYEWWYYCLWIMLMGSIFRHGVVRWASLFFSVLLIYLLPIKIILWMLIWLLGVLTYWYGRSSLPKPSPIIGVWVLILGLIFSRFSNHMYILAQKSIYIDFSKDFLLGLCYSLVLVSFFKIEKPFFIDGLHKKLASFSYTLYLVHFPALVILVAMAKELFGVDFLCQPEVNSYCYFLILICILFFYSYIFSLVTEKHTLKLIKLLS